MTFKIAMLLSNGFRPDPRVFKEALSLIKAGYQVHVICWDREKEFPEYENYHGIHIHRIQNVHTQYGAGIRQLSKVLQFWQAAIRQSLMLNPDIVHCHDLDTLYAGVYIKKRLGVPLIYDAHEDYPALMSLYLPHIMQTLLSGFEKWLLRSVDHTITASAVFAAKLHSRGVSPVTTIGNYQSLEPYNNLQEEVIVRTREDLGILPQDYVVAYIGGFTKNRQLIPLIDAIIEMPNVKLLLWGDGYQRKAIESAITNVPNIHYYGWLPAEEVPLYTSIADVIYYCLLPNYPGAVYNAPNTLSNAMAAGRPILANDVGDLGQIVNQTNCGLLIDTVTPNNIKIAIEKLRDPVLRTKLGFNGKKAALEKYNWDEAKKILLDIYQTLLV
jgi:glycosyltransferase involved in cell wall biosynthesis